MVAGDDSGGVDEQLKGLVTLLQSVGIDGVESSVLVEQQKRMSKRNPKRKGKSSKNAVANNAATTTTSDAQILEIIKKLQQAQSDSPEILEALKNPQLLALATLAAQKQTIQGQGRSSTRGQTKPKKSGAPSLDDVIDDDDDQYPKIGPGYSDEVSCISDISTPTVMTHQKVADEENYREVKGGPGALPPMHSMLGTPGEPVAGARPTRSSRAAIGRIGLGAPTAAGRTKNMVGQVRPLPSRRVVPTKTGRRGAAAQRRLNYQMAMSKLESTGFGKKPAPTVSPPESPGSSSNNNTSEDKKIKKTSGKTTPGTKSIESGSAGSGGSGSGSGRRKSSSAVDKQNKSNEKDIDWGMTDEKGWPTLEEDGDKTSKTTLDLVVDDNGFLSENAFSPTVKPKKSHRRKRSEKPSIGRSSENSEKPSIGRSSEHSKPSIGRSSENSEKPSSGRSSESSGSKSKKKSSREDDEGSSSKERSSSKTRKSQHRVRKHREKDAQHERRSINRVRRLRSKSTGKSPIRRSTRRPSLRT